MTTLVKVHDSHLQPEYQPGDWVQVQEATSADTGQVCIVKLKDGVNVLCRWPADGVVVGRVLEMYRRVP